MDKTLLIATENQHKLEEIAAIFAEAGLGEWQLLSLAALPGYIPPEEDGESFRDNAIIKAAAAAEASGLLCLADDSGLTVDALDGAPGIHSARYAGAHGDDAANRVKLLQELGDNQNRQAAFVCVAALVWPDGQLWWAEGELPGEIGWQERGEHGFGYDNLFYLSELGKSLAELAPEEKNRLSHRYMAMTKAARFLKRVAGGD